MPNLTKEELKARQRVAYHRWYHNKVANKECTCCTLKLDADSIAKGKKTCAECRVHRNAAWRMKYRSKVLSR